MGEITCLSTAEQIHDVGNSFELYAQEQGVSEAQTARILLVLDELLTNIRMHAYPNAPGRVSLSFSTRQDEGKGLLHICIKDWGAPFDPTTEAPVPNIAASLEQRSMGGLGIYITHKMANSFTYARKEQPSHEGGYNEIELTFLL